MEWTLCPSWIWSRLMKSICCSFRSKFVALRFKFCDKFEFPDSFHLDHCGALPWFLQKTSFKGRCFMTHATKAIYRWMLSDYIKVSNIATESMLYTEADLEASMEKIETINFHEERDVMGVRFWAYNGE